MTHFPKHPGCETCNLAKAQKKRAARVDKMKVSESSGPPPKVFGDLVTADHVVFSTRDKSHDDKRYLLSIYDRATQWVEATPCPSKDRATTKMALRDFVGSSPLKMLYSDNSGEIREAAKDLGWLHDTSTDNRPQTNGVIERQNRNILEGLRATLYESGLEHRFWSQAVAAWCVLHNVTKGEDINMVTPWQRRHGTQAKFGGQLVPFGAKIHYLPSADREVEARQKAAPRMIEGLFAGYKLLHDARWNGEYLVYDRMAYENWDGMRDLPVHTTKELYVPGSTPDSRDERYFQFPVRDGLWSSKAPSLNRYVRGRKRYVKRPKPANADAAEPDAGLLAEDPAPAALPPADAGGAADSPADALEGDSPDMFVELFKNLDEKTAAMDAGSAGGPVTEDPGPGSDVWVKRGEYIIRRHLNPRTTLFSPAEWLRTSGQPRIRIGSDDQAGIDDLHYAIDELEVTRETRPDGRSLKPHWDTWVGNDSKDTKMPPEYHFNGQPVEWTGETWFQLARPKRFECPRTGKPCTWVLGEKVEVRIGTTRPPDVLPSAWFGLFSQAQKRKHYEQWINVRKPAIELAEIERSKNGIGFLRKDDDLMAALGNEAPLKEKAHAFTEGLLQPMVASFPEQPGRASYPTTMISRTCYLSSTAPIPRTRAGENPAA